MSANPQLHRLEGISPKAYEHPADRAATAALQSIPMLDTVVRRLTEYQYERAFRQLYLASSVQIGPEQLPHVWAAVPAARSRRSTCRTYDLYVTQFPFANAAAIGTGKPMIVLNSATVTLLDEVELHTVLAHEVGHILSDHVLYRTALIILLRLGTSVRLPLVAGMPLYAVRSALLEWSRAAELTCDRAATLANRDPLVTCRTLMAIAAGLRSDRSNLDAFLRQATEFESGTRAGTRWPLRHRALAHAPLLGPTRRRDHARGCSPASSTGSWAATTRAATTGSTRAPRPATPSSSTTERFRTIFREAGARRRRRGGASRGLAARRRRPEAEGRLGREHGLRELRRQRLDAGPALAGERDRVRAAAVLRP